MDRPAPEQVGRRPTADRTAPAGEFPQSFLRASSELPTSNHLAPGAGTWTGRGSRPLGRARFVVTVNKEERAYLDAEYGDAGEGAWPPVRRRPDRRPWLAALLSLIVPGLGHVYVGQVRRGLCLWGALILVVIASAWSGLLDHFWGLVVMLVVVVGAYLYILVDAARRARSMETFAPGRWQRWWVYVGVVLFAALVVRPLVRFVVPVQSFSIPSASMEPTLQPGDHLIARKGHVAARDVERGDLVIFTSVEDPSATQVYRIIGLPGEVIDLVDKKVTIDGRPLEDNPAVHFDDPSTYPDVDAVHPMQRARDQLGPVEIPPDHVFVMGDNRDAAYDSRYFGPVPIENIKARPLYVYWSRRSAEPGLPGGPTKLSRIGLSLR